MTIRTWVRHAILLLAVASFSALVYKASLYENEINITGIVPQGLSRKNTENVSKNSSLSPEYVARGSAPAVTAHTTLPPTQTVSQVTTLQNFAPEDIEKVFADRRELVRQSCQKRRELASYKDNWQPGIFNRLRWLKKRDLVVCFSAKVGTSTWLEYLLLDKYPTEYPEWKRTNSVNVHSIAEKRLKPEYPKDLHKVVDELLNSTKVINVRHPFVRLVSAYRDKFEPCLTESTCYAAKLIKTWKSPLSFKSFVEYLVHLVPDTVSARMQIFKLFDNHWRPYFLNCAPCDIDYDYVVKMETWDYDVSHILKKKEFEQNFNFHRNRKDSNTVALEYFKALPHSLVKKLYERYALDFEMFGYSAEEYLI